MSRKFLVTKKVFLVLSILLFLAIPVISLISTALFWHGSCSSLFPFADACTWWQYAVVTMILISVIVIPILFLTFAVWLSMALAQFLTTRKK